MESDDFTRHYIIRYRSARELVLPPLGLVTAGQVAELLHTNVPETTGQLTPLCQAHYRHVHRHLHSEEGMYEHLKCFTCNARLKGPIRHCPNPVAIKQHFSRCGDIDICITGKDTIRTNCYNAHLQILQESEETSTDDELKALLQNSIPVEDKYPRYIAQAVQEVLTKVGIVLLKSLAVLLPEVYQLFVNEALNRAAQLGLDQSESVVKQEMPKQCVLSILASFFGKHIVFECKQRSCGVLIFRHGADLTLCLSKTLKLLRGTDNSILINTQHFQFAESTAVAFSNVEMSELDNFCSKMNNKIHNQIKTITSNDAVSPYDISQFDVDDTISNTDPMLWRMIVFLTRSTTETRKHVPPDKISQQRKLQCLYCLCVMLFATTRCCSVPLHILLTDLIDSQVGSYELIRILNRLGAVASVDTHRRYIQFQVAQKMSAGLLHNLDLSLFTVTSVDNIDFLQRHSFVYSGDQGRSWHGTTIQVVQPLTANETETVDEDREDIVQDSSYVCSLMDSSLETSDMCTSVVNSRLVPQKRHERPTPESSPTHTTTSPEHKKVSRRSRSFTEFTSANKSSDSFCHAHAQPLLPQAPSGMHPLASLSNNHYTALRLNHSLQENRELNHLQKIAFLFITLRYAF